MIACLYRRDQARTLQRGGYKYLEWTSNGTLQLQRLAYQGIKSGRWSGYTDDIPMTESGALLGDLTQSYPEGSQEQERGPDGLAGKTHAAAGLQMATVSEASEASEAAAGSSNSSGCAPTLVPEARGPDPVPGPQLTLAHGATGEGGRDLDHQTARLGSVPGSFTLGSDTFPVSPVSPLPRENEAPAPVSRDATCTINEVPQQRGTSGSNQAINYC